MFNLPRTNVLDMTTMKKSKKYDYRVVQDNGSWTAEILRRKTAKDTIVSKSKDGFVTESDAHVWGKAELKIFLQNLGERNKRRSKQRG